MVRWPCNWMCIMQFITLKLKFKGEISKNGKMTWEMFFLLLQFHLYIKSEGILCIWDQWIWFIKIYADECCRYINFIKNMFQQESSYSTLIWQLKKNIQLFESIARYYIWKKKKTLKNDHELWGNIRFIQASVYNKI